jgi:hypothetical protein
LIKNARVHLFPIGALTAGKLLKVLGRARNTGFIFKALNDASAALNGWSKSNAVLDQLFGVTEWTSNDRRRTDRRIREQALAASNRGVEPARHLRLDALDVLL